LFRSKGGRKLLGVASAGLKGGAGIARVRISGPAILRLCRLPDPLAVRGRELVIQRAELVLVPLRLSATAASVVDSGEVLGVDRP